MLARKIFPAVLILAVAACADHDVPTAASSSAPASTVNGAPAAPSLSAAAQSDEAHLEALARRVARALRDPAFRSYVKSELDRSTFPEHKVQFQRFLRLNGQQALRALAAASNENADAVAADTAAVALEMYFPVPAHRAAWSGDDNLLSGHREGRPRIANRLRSRRASAAARPGAPTGHPRAGDRAG